MTQLPPEVEQQIADMSEQDVDTLLARLRPPPEPTDPKARAAAALRRARGADRRGRATKESAAAALREYGNPANRQK
ncbi:hypothetical protein H7I53_18365 [Mycolicibacterium pulveris]|uniref:Uncharacterized protein n=1 Tax=Mycolicibacterium pulveris TaxID=36813 RepID=A0A7I7UTI9_MYCPV|nr:hypothetical protein [Mycolicibacterium pulveris]MCV6982181.1 hypothetical protein [Mycolicibacterium pulveris]BBY84173.1 hypothetical protein MPUL_53310 [Mycolicibacterium pulveris]